MSQRNTYPNPKESQPFSNRRGGGKSHAHVPSNKATSGGDKKDANFSYGGKADSYYKKG